MIFKFEMGQVVEGVLAGQAFRGEVVGRTERFNSIIYEVYGNVPYMSWGRSAFFLEQDLKNPLSRD